MAKTEKKNTPKNVYEYHRKPEERKENTPSMRHDGYATKRGRYPEKGKSWETQTKTN